MRHPMAEWWFAIENLSITLGYVFVAVVVAPLFLRRVGVRFLATKIGGVGFFLLCGLTHLHMACQVLFHDHTDMATDPVMHLIHAPQAVAVWMFVIGLYMELIDVNWTVREPRASDQ